LGPGGRGGVLDRLFSRYVECANKERVQPLQQNLFRERDTIRKRKK